MILGIISVLVGVAALILAIMALVQISDMDDRVRRMKSDISELSDTVRHKVESFSHRLAELESSGSGLRSEVPTAPPARKEGASPQQRKRPPAPPAPPPPPPSRPPEPEPEPEPPAAEEAPRFINFDCPHCGQNIDGPPALAGVVVACPSCSRQIVVPTKSGAEAAAVDSMDDAPAMPHIGPEDEGEEEMKGTTVRIDLSGMIEEIQQRPKRQIVIKRKQG